MNYEKIAQNILNAISRDPFASEAYSDLLSVCRQLEPTDPERSHQFCKDLRRTSRNAMQLTVSERRSATETGVFYDIYNKALLFDAPTDLDAYLLYIETPRPAEKKFYVPRRKILRPLVQDLQDLDDGKLNFLGISLPPRVGKSTLCIFFMTWIMGKYPDVASVMSGHSDKLTEGFYTELLSILQDPEQYLWHDVFPDVPFESKSAKNETINLGKSKHYPTMTCRSISGTLTGAVEIGNNGILYCDDLVEDLEESLNPIRLQNKYDAYLNQLKDRKKLLAKELMVGTRWNVMDPLGRIQDQYRDDPSYRFRVIPALNEDDESNFNYSFGVGFDTHYYHDMRNSIDDATWWAKYMGHPYVREGLLFPEAELSYYNGVLPDGDCEVLAVCDVAWGGGDFLSMPFLYQFGECVYVHDWIFNDKDKTVTRPIVVGRMKQHMPYRAVFEANNGGHEYADIVDTQLREDGIHISITSKVSKGNQSKLARIIQYAPDVKKFYFLDRAHRSKEYQKAMEQLTMFVQTGKNEHDDSPDSLALAASEIFHGTGTVEIFRRPV